MLKKKLPEKSLASKGPRTRPDRRGPADEPPTIQVWVEADLEGATLVREPGESEEHYTKRKRAIDWLLKAARR